MVLQVYTLYAAYLFLSDVELFTANQFCWSFSVLSIHLYGQKLNSPSLYSANQTGLTLFHVTFQCCVPEWIVAKPPWMAIKKVCLSVLLSCSITARFIEGKPLIKLKDNQLQDIILVNVFNVLNSIDPICDINLSMSILVFASFNIVLY